MSDQLVPCWKDHQYCGKALQKGLYNADMAWRSCPLCNMHIPVGFLGRLAICVWQRAVCLRVDTPACGEVAAAPWHNQQVMFACMHCLVGPPRHGVRRRQVDIWGDGVAVWGLSGQHFKLALPMHPGVVRQTGVQQQQNLLG
jgi:hypothetical protein